MKYEFLEAKMLVTKIRIEVGMKASKGIKYRSLGLQNPQ